MDLTGTGADLGDPRRNSLCLAVPRAPDHVPSDHRVSPAVVDMGRCRSTRPAADLTQHATDLEAPRADTDHPWKNFKEVVWLVVLDPMLLFVGPQDVPRLMRHGSRGGDICQEHKTSRLLSLTGNDLSPRTSVSQKPVHYGHPMGQRQRESREAGASLAGRQWTHPLPCPAYWLSEV